MKSPFTGKEMKVGQEMRQMTFRKESFPVVFHYYYCEDTEEQFEDEHFSALNYNQVVNQYRVRHHIPFPDQIKEIRLKYDLSATRMSDILGLGTNSWRNYEGGEVPSTAIATLIHTMANPETFMQHVQSCAELTDKERDRILNHIHKLKTGSCFCTDPLCRFEVKPDIYTGFKAFDRIKTKHVILYFSELLKPYRTKLNKLLFYSDFVHFRDNAQSITGLVYKAIPYGPVPNNYDMLFGILSEQGIIDIDYIITQNGEFEKILPNPQYQFDASLFSPTELEVMTYIADKFKDITASDIAEISHREAAWKDNIDGKKIIPFTYAFGLETV